jgi:hypothetical protein
MRGKTRHRVREAPGPEALEKWKRHAGERLAHLKEQLSQVPEDAVKARARGEWLDRMANVVQSRTEWLEARLEHANALADVLHGTKEPKKSAKPAGQQRPRPARTEVRRRRGRH